MPPAEDERPLGRRALLRAAWRASALGLAAAACSRPERLTSTTGSTTVPDTTSPPSSTTASSTPSASSPTSTSTPSTTSSSSTTTSTTTTTTTTTSTTTTTPTPTTGTGTGTGTGMPPGSYDREARYVALYGHPGSSVLGALGEQDPEAGARRAREQAAAYADFGRPVVPTFEILASVASAEPGSDGDFSNEFSFDRFEPHLRVAAANGMHVVFDLQTGRSRFPDQARQYEALWLQPHASIALDPEWRVGPDERPGGGLIGTVDAAEVNETIDYVDRLIRANDLPPKMCIVHQFRTAMVTNRHLVRGTDNVQLVVHMDGFGSLDLKRGTWRQIVRDLPPDALTGWKNFYDEDRPTPTPAETMANEPQPRYVSYQ